MNLALIETFLELVKYGSFTTASEKLIIPQPTLTHRMKQLEQELGDKLIYRDHKGISLTETGKMFMPYAIQILEGMKKGKQRIEHAKKGYSDTLNIGASLALSHYVLPKLLEQFIKQYKNLHINVTAHPSDLIIEKLRENHFSFGLTRYAIQDEHISFESVHQDHVLLVVCPEHRFTSTKAITLLEACSEPLILYREGTYFRNFIEFSLTKYNLLTKTPYETNHVELIKSLVKANHGISFLPKLYVNKELEQGELISVPMIDSPFPPRNTYIACNNKHGDFPILHFLELIRTFFKTY